MQWQNPNNIKAIIDKVVIISSFSLELLIAKRNAKAKSIATMIYIPSTFLSPMPTNLPSAIDLSM